MLQLKNTTPFTVGMALFPNEKGIDTLYVTVKATFTLKGQSLTVAEQQLPMRMTDMFWGEPGQSSLKFAAEVQPTKPATDVALVGTAHAPDARPVSQLDVSLRVGPVRKVIRVFGDRQWTGDDREARISPPLPFTTMPLIYERAFGGKHEADPARGEILFEARNPVGKGFPGGRALREMSGLPLPNLEDPARLIRQIQDLPNPAGYGYCSPTWEPRKALAGTYDAAWTQRRAPYLPEDFNPRFFNAAHPDLICPEYLRGGEPVLLQNLSPTGPISFSLPLCEFDTTVDLAGTDVMPRMNLDTVLLEPDEARLSLFWRTGVECDKKALKVSQVDVALKNFVMNGEKV